MHPKPTLRFLAVACYATLCAAIQLTIKDSTANLGHPFLVSWETEVDTPGEVLVQQPSSGIEVSLGTFANMKDTRSTTWTPPYFATTGTYLIHITTKLGGHATSQEITLTESPPSPDLRRREVPSFLFARGRKEEDGPAARLRRMDPGPRAGVIAGIVIGTVLITVLSTWLCCWPCCCFPNAGGKRERKFSRFFLHKAAAKDAEQQDAGGEQSCDEECKPDDREMGNTVVRGELQALEAHGQLPELGSPELPATPPPAYRDIK